MFNCRCCVLTIHALASEPTRLASRLKTKTKRAYSTEPLMLRD
ncbi:hypothetical protein BTN50_0548 [Candidatus Enterovibrio altilux]|uniref:Uncharacterized protein n=1 Tax=Candidatus Enterovibrio altilux TaxID=1927128 RepID=A0A291B7U9_9GAMM|nr:hypothetical protein BTN50_0548 [Candidatus Enterovibrio luxaltus]